MLFNSPEFLLVFLPITLIGCFALNRANPALRLPVYWLIAASLFFYAWWEPKNLALLLFSIGANYLLSQKLIAQRTGGGRPSKALLVLGIAINLGLIAWFKYANFLEGNFEALTGLHVALPKIVLPLAISFFTFQQISYLVDGYKGQVERCSFVDYALVVTFFPHLIAGPIVRYQQVLPQFHTRSFLSFDRTTFGIGLTLFVAGLFKKVVFADSIAVYANKAFDAAAQGIVLDFSEAWIGVLSYSFQLYFDFSGYSDMAIGLAYMVGIRFAANFNSPYKATSIVDFWRRWHMTLSSFLRDYLYIALGGSRCGKVRRYANLFLTMLLGGLWHGAGWNFVIWGGLHGSYLMVNHGWRAIARGWRMPAALGWALTFGAAVIAWVPFRAIDLHTTATIWSSMAGLHGVQLPAVLEPLLGFLRHLGASFDALSANVGIPQKYSLGGIVVLMAIAVGAPNTMQWLGCFNPALVEKDELAPSGGVLGRLFRRWEWQPTALWSAFAGALAAICLLCFTRVSQFIYFQF